MFLLNLGLDPIETIEGIAVLHRLGSLSGPMAPVPSRGPAARALALADLVELGA